MSPLLGGFKDVDVLAVVVAKPHLPRILADAGAAVRFTALVVVERLRSAVVFGHQVALDIAERFTDGIFKKSAAVIPSAASSQAGHRARTDQGLHLAQRVVSLAENRELMLGITVVMAVNRPDCARWLSVTDCGSCSHRSESLHVLLGLVGEVEPAGLGKLHLQGLL